MNMQDKEFDNLFRANLDDFETEPSATVWQGIDAGLRNDNRRKLLIPLLSAAASIIVLVTAGVLLIPHHVKNAAGHLVKGNMAKNGIPAKTPVTAPSNKIAQLAQINTTVNTSAVKQIVAIQPVKKQPAIAPQQPTNSSATEQSSLKQPAQEMIAAVPQKHDELTQPKQIDTVALAANNVSVPDIKPAQVAVPDKQVVAKVNFQAPKKHHIHSLGDMLNTVIAAVDKRKDKLLEFSDTDDNDDSMITGVNLGVVAVKKQN